MKRRRALSVVGLSALPLSGCLDSVGRDGTPGDPGSGDGRSVTASLSRVAGDGAIGFSCDVRRSEIGEGSPAVVELTARNETEREIEYVTGAPEPFGVLYDPDAPAAILWTEKYVESQHVETEGRRVTGGDDIGISVALAPGGSRSETYEFAAPPGSYSIRQTGNPITLGEETYELRIDVSEA
ncbi:hypothetical protein [Halorubrum sp. Ea8]|uniref:hypothetical protein n=1 Tax=Halorubrum sp. Ea8 TaxID=1383841 RepID=UPI000B980C7B|nr:hypothetical protein [Halorubrum sp. Ea8]OYR45296.1 hypothetical protein DJ74_16425 [Halorubrum sp. Ea8]